jgi:hypothetical protein
MHPHTTTVYKDFCQVTVDCASAGVAHAYLFMAKIVALLLALL